MPIPAQRDPDVAAKQIASWLATKIEGSDDVRVLDITFPGVTGFSNETLIFDAEWTVDGTRHRQGLVLRVEPKDYRLFLESEFEAQFTVMQTLDQKTDVPMPPMLWYEPDPSVLGSGFYVMGKVDGVTPSDSPPYHLAGFLAESTPQQQEQLWWSGLETMAAIHQLNWKSLGLSILDRPRRGKVGLEQQLRYYREYFDWARDGREVETLERAFAWCEANKPSDEPTTLVWGDSRIGNMLFRDYRCVAVLDWEMVSLGNPEQDLAWFLYLDRYHSQANGNPRLPGLPSHEATVKRYEELTGRPVEHLHYYTVFAGLRFATILLRLGTLMIGYGLSQPGADPGLHRSVGAMLEHDLSIA